MKMNDCMQQSSPKIIFRRRTTTDTIFTFFYVTNFVDDVGGQLELRAV